jgi:hypothetical protein
MSDTSQGPGWWVASDGKWYPPEQRPDDSPSTDMTETTVAPESPEVGPAPWWKQPVPLWLVIVIAFLALGVGAAVAASDEDDGAGPEGGDDSTTTVLDDERDAGVTTTTVRTTTSATRPATTTTQAPTTTSTAPPWPGFGGGTQIVGTDVEPGIYIVTGTSFCYWERLSGLSGEFGEIIANNNVNGQGIVEIAPTDVAFSSQGCGRWELDEPPAEPVDTFGSGDWIVGEQIQPGRYRSDVEAWCYWERASGLSHNLRDIVANDNVTDGSAIVEIAPGDRRFSSSGCGTWRRV